MAARVPRSFESQLDITSLGPRQIRDARAIEEHVSNNQEQWPYRNLIPEPKARRVFVPGFIVAPAVNTATTLVSYTVPQCFAFSLKKLFVEAEGSTPNPGDFTWSLAKNTTPGSTIAYSQIIDGYLNVPFGLGSAGFAPWPLEQPELFQPNDVVSIILTNVLPLGGFFRAGLLGFLYPEMEV